MTTWHISLKTVKYMNIDVKTWKDFLISDLFEVRGTKTTPLLELQIYGEGVYPYVTTQSTNNGVGGFFNYYTEEGNVLTVDSAVAGVCKYQSNPFSASDHVEKLVPKFEMNFYSALFILSVINKNQYKYSYGRKASQKMLKKELIRLPVNSQGLPDYAFMEEFIKHLKSKKVKTKISKKSLMLNVSDWKEYRLDYLFSFKKGKRLTKANMIKGNLNYLGAINDNNGVREKIQADEFYINKPNCITINYNGSVGEAFYQSEPFWASDDVNVLYPIDWEMNKYNALFIVAIIKKNKYRFSYGRKWTLEKMKETIIRLPSDIYGNPDFKFMEDYMKQLPFSDRI